MNEVQNIQRILPQHYAIIDMAVAGHTPKVIAETMGRSVESVRLLLNAPNVQHEIAQRRKEGREAETLGLDRDATLGKARSILEQATVRAAQVHVDLMECHDPTVALRSADKVLERALGSEGGSKATIVNVSAEQIALINLTLKELNSHVQRNPANEAPALDSGVRGRPDVQQDGGHPHESAHQDAT